MKTINEIPEEARKSFLREINIARILDGLSDEKNFTSDCNYSVTGVGNVMVRIFSPLKTILEFSYINLDFENSKPTDIIKPVKLELNFYNCVDVLKIQDEKQMRAIKILKEKNVNIAMLEDCYFYEEYNEYAKHGHKNKCLTLEEFNLLKTIFA